MKKMLILLGVATIATVLYAAGPTVLTGLKVEGDLEVTGTTTVSGYIPSAQTDTNATTTATSYTPAAVGQVLIGGAGTGTNAVWIAKGVTTNDWVQVAP